MKEGTGVADPVTSAAIPTNQQFTGVKPVEFATNGKTTPAHAVGEYLKNRDYNKIDGPWVVSLKTP